MDTMTNINVSLKKQDVKLETALTQIYDALRQKGHNPVNQITGYLLSDDPTYITNHNGARSLVRHVDNYELLQFIRSRFFAYH